MDRFDVNEAIRNTPLSLVAHVTNGKVNRSVEQADARTAVSTVALQAQADQPLCGRGAWLACLTLRDSLKIFRDLGLYAMPLVRHAPSATGSVSMPKSCADPSLLVVPETLVRPISIAAGAGA